MAYNSFPYSDYHELNLDYLLNKAKAIEENVTASAESATLAGQKATIATQQANASANSALASAQSAQASAQSAQASETSATQARAAAGDPKTFTAAAQLTDPEKIYVYVGGTTATYTYGHFYYYSGGVWHDGGVYGTWTTDNALSPTSTNAVQNKVLKGNFDTLDSAVDLIVKGTTTYNSYVQGYRTQSDYYNVHTQTTRCTSADVYHVYAGDTVTISNIASGTKCAILATPPIYDSGWKTADFTYTATADQIVFVECAASDDTADILPSAITTVLTIEDRASRVTENAEDISSLKSDVADLDAATFSDNLAGAFPGVYYKIDPPIKIGESFTVTVANGGTTGQWVEYEWCDENKDRISYKRLYANTTTQTTVVATKDMYYFRWLGQPTKLIKVERGVQGTAYTPYFKPFVEYAVEMNIAHDYYKQRISYDLFKNAAYVTANGNLMASANYLCTDLIPLNAGDIVHYRLVSGTGEGIISSFDSDGVFIENLVVGLGVNTINEGTFTIPYDCFVIMTNRFYNFPTTENFYCYINDSIFEVAKNATTESDVAENTFVSGYGTLDGWETHAEAFSKLMLDVVDTEGFMFFTDSHYMSKTGGTWKPYMYRIFSYLEKLYYSSPCSFVLHGGDWLGTGEAREDYLYKLSAINGAFRRNFDKYALLVGNHECGNQSAEHIMFTHDTLANTLLANVGKTYYRFDTNTFHMYCFDSWQSGALDSYANEQIAWFAQALETETADHIVIAIHILYDSNTLKGMGDELTKCADAYNNRSSYTYNGNTYTFTSATGKVGFVIAGHEHIDQTGTVNNIPYILTKNLTGYGGEANFDRLPLPLDLVKVDWNNATLTAYRAARGAEGTTRTLEIIA